MKKTPMDRFNLLPEELIREIFEFDNTYKIQYDNVMNFIPEKALVLSKGCRIYTLVDMILNTFDDELETDIETADDLLLEIKYFCKELLNDNYSIPKIKRNRTLEIFRLKYDIGNISHDFYNCGKTRIADDKYNSIVKKCTPIAYSLIDLAF